MHAKLLIVSSAITGLVLFMVYGSHIRKILKLSETNASNSVVGSQILLQGGLADEERPRPCATASNGRLFCNKQLHGQETPEVFVLAESSANKVSLFSTKTQKYCVDRGEHVVCNSAAPYEFESRRFNNNARIAFKGRRGWCVDKTSNIECLAPNVQLQQSRFVLKKPQPAPLPSSATMPSPSSVTPDVPTQPPAETQTSSVAPSSEQTSSVTPSTETQTSSVTPSTETQTSSVAPSSQTQTSSVTPSAETQTSSVTSSSETQTSSVTPSSETQTFFTETQTDTLPSDQAPVVDTTEVLTTSSIKDNSETMPAPASITQEGVVYIDDEGDIPILKIAGGISLGLVGIWMILKLIVSKKKM